MIDKDGRKYFRRLREAASAASGITNITGISESRSAAIAGLIAKARGGQTLIVTSSYGRAKRLAEDLPLFVAQKVLLFPDEDRSHMAYEAKSHHDLIERLSSLTALAKGEDCIVVAPVLGAVKKLAPKEIFCRYAFTLRVGQEENTEELRNKLSRMGYERTGLVESRGQYSFRGGILDVFPPDFEYPCRIEFFDVEVDSIRFFDPLSQRSLHKSEEVTVFPAEQIISEEHLFDQTANRIRAAYEHFSQKLTGEKREKLAERENRILEYLSTGTNVQYLENYIPYFYEDPAYLWDYLNPGATVIADDHDRIMDTLTAAEKEFTEEFKVRLDRGEAGYRRISGRFQATGNFCLPIKTDRRFYCHLSKNSFMGSNTWRRFSRYSQSRPPFLTGEWISWNLSFYAAINRNMIFISPAQQRNACGTCAIFLIAASYQGRPR